MGEGKRKTIIAVALNALVIPGAGHIYIGYKVRGFVLMIACVFFIVVPLARFSILMTYALNLMGPSPTGLISDLLNAANIIWPEVRGAVLIATAALTIIWIFGIADVYMKSRCCQGIRD